MGHKRKGSKRSRRSSSHSKRREELKRKEENKRFGIALAIGGIMVIAGVIAIYAAWEVYFNDDDNPDPNGGDGGDGGDGKLYADIVTSKGKIVVELNEDAAPITVENFKKYANDGFYDGLIFHRVIKDFMVQGGGFYPDMTPKSPTYGPIKNEALTAGLANVKYTIAMARTNEADSATSQFFINTVDNDFLNPGGNSEAGYCVFGKVTEGFGVVDNIEIVPTTTEGSYSDVPVSDVTITTVTIRET